MAVWLKILSISVVLCQETWILNAKYVEGTLQTTEDWHFLGRFCFRPNNGKLKYEVEFPLVLESQRLLFYYDRDGQWPSIYKTGLSCEDKIKPTIRGGSSMSIVLSEQSEVCKSLDQRIVRCEGQRSFSSSRDMWWYLAISRCFNSSFSGIVTNYKLHWTNGAQKNLFYYEFSADEYYIFETNIAFLLACLILLTLASISAYLLQQRLMFHSTFKIFLFSLLCQCIFLMIMLTYYGKYGSDGRENFSLRTFGGVIEVIGNLSFITMLLLMAKGFTITRGRISTCGLMKLIIFMTLYALIYIILFFYDAAFSDPGLVVYIYESPPGYGIIALRFLAWMYFSYATFMNLKNYREKSKFYVPFYILFTLWFWAGSITVLVANFALDKWARARVVNGVDRAVAFGGFLFILFLTRPSNSNKNFPYHVRTSQVGILTDDGDYDLGGRAYAPTDDKNKIPDLTAFFSVANTRLQMNGLNTSVANQTPVETSNHLQTVPTNEDSSNIKKY